MMVTADSWRRRVWAALRGRLHQFRLPRQRQGSTGHAQVRLELAASVMGVFHRELDALRPPEIDREALLQRLRAQACGGCVLRTS